MSGTRQSSTLGRTFMVVLAVLAVTLFGLPFASAQNGQANGKLSKGVADEIRAAAPDDLLPVIIQTVAPPSEAHFTRLHGRGGMVKTQYSSIKGYTAQVPASQIADLADDPEVERVSEDAPVAAHLDVAWKVVNGQMAALDFSDLSGRGVGIAVVDTGVAGHPDLLRPKGSPQVVEVEIVGHENGLADYFGHGTHVAGILAGNGASSSDKFSFRTFRGVAPGAQIISLRALSPDGTGYTSDIIAGIDWAIKFRSVYNIRVLNLSLGHPVFESYATDPMCRAVRAANDAGILVVVAVGNDGRIGSGFGTITSPGNEPRALTVGAVDDSSTVTLTDDVLAPYSSKGPSLVDFVVKPDMVAPGTFIVSARATGSYLDTTYHQFTLKLADYRNDPSAVNVNSSDKDGQYFEMSGTSMAAPMVAGAAALMFEKDPTLTPATVKARLMKSAVKDDKLVFETGAGMLDVDAALKQGGVARSADSVTALSDVSADILAAYGGIWGGKGGNKSIIDNNQITSSGLIWDALACSLPSTSGTVDNMGGIWGKRGN